jgi:hypothetical protein
VFVPRKFYPALLASSVFVPRKFHPAMRASSPTPLIAPLLPATTSRGVLIASGLSRTRPTRGQGQRSLSLRCCERQGRKVKPGSSKKLHSFAKARGNGTMSRWAANHPSRPLCRRWHSMKRSRDMLSLRVVLLTHLGDSRACDGHNGLLHGTVRQVSREPQAAAAAEHLSEYGSRSCTNQRHFHSESAEEKVPQLKK